IYIGKLVGNVMLMLLVEAILLLLFGVFFNLDLGRHLWALAAVIALGTVGFAAVGILFAAMTAQVRARELLFPVLLLPVLVPVLLGAVKATEAVLGGEGLGGVTHWLKLLAAADAVYVAVGVLTFDAILEGCADESCAGMAGCRGHRRRARHGLPRGAPRGHPGQRAADHVPSRAERARGLPGLRRRPGRVDRVPDDAERASRSRRSGVRRGRRRLHGGHEPPARAPEQSDS